MAVSVSPYSINVSDEVLDDLNRRLEMTRFPKQVTGTGWDRGVDLDYMKELVDYWLHAYDWRQQETLLNEYQHFKADVDGLEILDVDGKWFRSPQMHNAILVNTGQFLERWSNDRFRATPHRVIPPKGVDRYSIALFVNSAFEPVCECLPTCTSPDNPPKYPTQSYYDFYLWYMQNTYPHYGGFEEELADRD